jgi:hypothetical protein
MRKCNIGFLVIISIFLICYAKDSLAVHPLITDDAYTQGKGAFQVELASEYVNNKDTDADKTTNVVTTGATFTYGAVDNMDIVLTSGYQSIRDNIEGVTSRNDGVTDSGIDVKWKFYERKDNFSLAIKPGIIFPTGDYEKGLGSGKVRYRFFFISSKELEPLTVHLNIGYMRNENKLDERKDILHTSLAGEWKVAKRLRFVANTGIETCRDKSHIDDPAFILAGFIYAITEKIDLDLGVKGGITRTENSFTALGGVTFRF